MKTTGPLARLRLLHGIVRLGRRCGQLDAEGQLGSFGMAWLRARRRDALEAGCLSLDIDEATIEGLEQGRQSS